MMCIGSQFYFPPGVKLRYSLDEADNACIDEVFDRDPTGEMRMDRARDLLNLRKSGDDGVVPPR